MHKQSKNSRTAIINGIDARNNIKRIGIQIALVSKSRAPPPKTSTVSTNESRSPTIRRRLIPPITTIVSNTPMPIIKIKPIITAIIATIIPTIIAKIIPSIAKPINAPIIAPKGVSNMGTAILTPGIQKTSENGNSPPIAAPTIPPAIATTIRSPPNSY